MYDILEYEHTLADLFGQRTVVLLQAVENSLFARTLQIVHNCSDMIQTANLYILRNNQAGELLLQLVLDHLYCRRRCTLHTCNTLYYAQLLFRRQLLQNRSCLIRVHI